MKKFILIPFLSLILISCSKNNKENNVLAENVETNNLNKSTNANPITIEYSNTINGYKVSVNWIIKEYANYHGERYFVGPATLKFTNEKNNEQFYIQHPEYSINISKENLKYISLENSDIFKGNQSFTQKNDYKSPSTSKVGIYSENSEDYDNNSSDEYIPFFFQDVNFDNENELILTSAIKWDKGGSQNILFSKTYDTEFLEMKNEPFSNFSGFYNGNSESLAYGNTKIDYKNKRIIESGICGAMCSSEIVYEFKTNEVLKSYILSKKTEINIDDKQEETLVTSYNDIGKPISINRK